MFEYITIFTTNILNFKNTYPSSSSFKEYVMLISRGLSQNMIIKQHCLKARIKGIS
jgi:hypothetical protein